MATMGFYRPVFRNGDRIVNFCSDGENAGKYGVVYHTDTTGTVHINYDDGNTGSSNEPWTCYRKVRQFSFGGSKLLLRCKNMFSKKMSKEEYKEQEFRLIDKELELYRQRKELELDEEIAQRRQTEMKTVEELAFQCVEDTRTYEHDFHSAKEKLGVELVKLESEVKDKESRLKNLRTIDDLSEQVHKYKAQAEAKDLVIDSMKETIKLLDDSQKVVIGKLSTIDIKSLGLNITSKVEKEK